MLRIFSLSEKWSIVFNSPGTFKGHSVFELFWKFRKFVLGLGLWFVKNVHSIENLSKSTIIKLVKSKLVFLVKSFQRPLSTLLAYAAAGQNHLVVKLMDMPEVKFIASPTILSYRVAIWQMAMELVVYQFMENSLMMKISIYTIMGQVGSQWQMLAKVRTLPLKHLRLKISVEWPEYGVSIKKSISDIKMFVYSCI